MSDPLDTLLNELLIEPPPYVSDDGFSQAILARIAQAQFRRTRLVSWGLASLACMLFALASAVALRAQLTSPAASIVLPVVLSLAFGTLVLSRSIVQLFQE